MLALPALLAACADDEPRTSAPPTTTTTTTTAREDPAPARDDEPVTTTTTPDAPPTTVPETPAPDTPGPVTVPQEPRVGSTPTQPRTAPAFRAGILRFDRIVVLREDGRFAGRANVTNQGGEYLNGVRLRWRVLGPMGATLDQGLVTWPSLAPGETATVHFAGSRPYRKDWRRVVFEIT
jgi:hypothetical protein